MYGANFHSKSVIEESISGEPLNSLSVGLFLPSYLDAASFLHKKYPNTFPIGKVLEFLLAGSLGGISAHDAEVVANTMSPGANNHLTVTDISPGVLPIIARRGGGYEFIQTDLLESIPGNQDIILANILLGYIIRSHRYINEIVSTLERFANNSYQALKPGGALIMVENMSVEVTTFYLELLREIGFTICSSPATRFVTREKADQFLASTQVEPPTEDIEKDDHIVVIIAVKNK